MSCLAFAAALQEPDNDVSNLNLHKLTTAGTFTGDTLSSVAEDYLRAFGDAALSHIRRRWIGIALAHMLAASPNMLDHIDAVQLQSLGDVILSSTVREETKIVAGFIMRQALESRVDFACFWTSDKVRNSAPNFPKDSGPQWLVSFQSFLDTLGDLALANPVTDPSILYPVAVLSSDSFQWASSDKGLPVAIVQHDLLTIMLPDGPLRDIQFLDVPITNVHSTETRPSAPLYDSQSRNTTHEPWDFVVKLKSSAWNYSLNTNKRTANELTILFGRSEDAQECELSVNELMVSSEAKMSAQHQSAASRSSSLDMDAVSPKNVKDTKQPRQVPAVEALQPETGNSKRRIIFRSSPIEISRRLPSRQNDETEQFSSSDQLGKTPAARSHLSLQSIEPTLTSKPSQTSHHGHLARKQDLASAGQDQNHIETTRMAEHEQQLPESGNSETHTRQAQRRLRESRDQTHSRSSGRAAVLTRTQSIQALSGPADSPTSTTSFKENLPAQDGTTSQFQFRGKLRRVSLATKQISARELREKADIFEIPDDSTRKPGNQNQNTLDNASDLERVPHTGERKASASSQTQRRSNHGKNTRSKRRAEEDDDFVPVKKPARKFATQRKSVAEAADIRQQPRKKSKTEHGASDPNAPLGAPSSQVRAYHVDVAFDKRPPEALSQRQKPKDAEKPRVPAVVLRTPLIGGLLGLQKPASTTKASFKKPAIPSRPQHHPSTPTKHLSVPFMPRSRPQTPGVMQKSPNAYAVLMSSSPPGNDMIDKEHVEVQTDAAEAEILSSNSKPVPACPHAESTAISGHADHDDVALKKRQGEVQIARLDPFQQRREGRKSTSFIRRLTGDDLVHGETGSVGRVPPASAPEAEITVSSDGEDLLVKNSSQPLPRGHSAAARTTKARVPALQSGQPKRKTTEDLESSRNIPTKKSKLSVTHQPAVCSEPSSVVTQEAVLVAEQRNDATLMVDSVLTAPRQLVDDTQTEEPEAEARHDIDADGETTLVDNEDESDDPLPMRKDTFPTFIRLSPPGTPGSHSSTSAEPETSPRTPMPTSEAEAEEWEATLHPHQRALHDLLIRVSKRVLRHVVDNETAVTDIAEVYASDGEHLLNELLQRQDSEYKVLGDEMTLKKRVLRKQLESSAKALAKERRRVDALT